MRKHPKKKGPLDILFDELERLLREAKRAFDGISWNGGENSGGRRRNLEKHLPDGEGIK